MTERQLTVLHMIRTVLQGIEHSVRQKGILDVRDALALIQAVMLVIDYLEEQTKAGR